MIRIFVTTAAVFFVSAAPTAQTKPNFSGRWVLDAEKTAAGGVSPITIAMNAATLKITVPSKDGSGNTTTYTLDGSERKTIVMPVSGQTIEEISKATTDGATVVIKTTGTRGETVSRWYFEGAWLVNERTTQAGTFKAFYRKG